MPVMINTYGSYNHNNFEFVFMQPANYKVERVSNLKEMSTSLLTQKKHVQCLVQFLIYIYIHYGFFKQKQVVFTQCLISYTKTKTTYKTHLCLQVSYLILEISNFITIIDRMDSEFTFSSNFLALENLSIDKLAHHKHSLSHFHDTNLHFQLTNFLS